VVDGRRLRDAEVGGEHPPGRARGAHVENSAPQRIARGGPLVERARGLHERHRLVELEAVLLLAPRLEAQIFALGRVARQQPLAHRAGEDLRE
jgi:hypothetical protein